MGFGWFPPLYVLRELGVIGISLEWVSHEGGDRMSAAGKGVTTVST